MMMNPRRSSLLGDGVMMPSVQGSIESLLNGRDLLSTSAPSVLLTTQAAGVVHGVDTEHRSYKTQVGATWTNSYFILITSYSQYT